MPRFFFTFLFTFCVAHAHAQWHIGFDTGYRFKWNSSRIGDASSNMTGPVATKTVFATSFGQGAQYGVAVSYMRTQHAEVELNLSYLNGNITAVTQKTLTDNKVEHYATQMFRVTPSLKLKGGQKKVKVFGRLGFGIGFGGSISQQTQYHSGNQKVNSTTWVYSGGVTRHLVLGLGIERSVGRRSPYRFFAEFRLFSGTYSPSKGELTKSEQNGQDRLPSLTVMEKHTVYQSTIKSLTMVDPDQPMIALRERFPFSSIGLNIGITRKF